MCAILCRLHDFLSKKRLKLCGESAGYGGNCITDHDTVNLWRLYLEVYTMHQEVHVKLNSDYIEC